MLPCRQTPMVRYILYIYSIIEETLFSLHCDVIISIPPGEAPLTTNKDLQEIRKERRDSYIIKHLLPFDVQGI